MSAGIHISLLPGPLCRGGRVSKVIPILLLCTGLAHSQCTNGVCTNALSPDGHWTLLNMAADTASGDIGCYTSSQVQFAPNAMTIAMAPKTATCNQSDTTPSTEPYLSGAVVLEPAYSPNTSTKSGHLVMMVRAQMGRGWPSIWMLGHGCDPSVVGSWDNVGTCNWNQDASDSAELDIAENYESGGYTSPGHNKFDNGTSVACGGPTVSDVTQNFHTYYVDWTNTSADMKVDGVDANCGYTSNIPTGPANLIIENRVNPAGAPPSGVFPTVQTVQWVQICDNVCQDPGNPQAGDNTIFFDNFSSHTSKGNSVSSTSLTVTSGGTAVTSVAAGTVVTLTAMVTSGSIPVAAGQVKFCNAAAAHCEDSALIGTAQLTKAGIATYRFGPGIGSHSYQAVFAGTKNYTASTSAAVLLTVTGSYPTGTAISSSGVIGNYTLTGTVTGSGSTLAPSGAISFNDTTNGNALLGSGTLWAPTFGENFVLSSTPAVGNEPVFIAIGDFNGDGIPDFATANQADATITILLGNGNGTFTVKSTPSVGSQPSGIVVGDFNGDGIPDLAVANRGAATVSVLLGNGDGTFTAKSTPVVGAGPAAVTTGDFNGDGILDLATANYTANSITVLLGNGDGTFTANSTISIDVEPGSIAVSDFNGDGVPDLATANYGDSTVTVLLGNGDGTFTTKSSPAVGSGPESVAVADFNGDGIPDLATANSGNNTVTVLLGNGDGTFNTRSTPQVGRSPTSVVTGDFNGNGISDLATGNDGDGTISVLLGNGNGTFTAQTAPSAGASPIAIGMGDFNGDGVEDLVAANNAAVPATATVLLNQITETAQASLSSVSVSGSEMHQVAATYSGNNNYGGSTSGIVSLLAAPIAIALTLAATPNPSYASSVMLTATLSPYSYGPFSATGETVTFRNGTTVLGTGSLSAGVATLNVGSLPTGIDTLTASYSGDGSFAGATSNTVAEVMFPPPAAEPVISPPGGKYFNTQSVTITDATLGATIYYTTDGTTPNRSSAVFNINNPIIVSSTEVIKALAVAPGYLTSQEGVASYTIDPPYAPTPTFSIAGGFYSRSVTVTITDALNRANIYYTTNGITWTPYSGPITISTTQILQAIATASNYLQSTVALATYYIAAAQPQISPPSGTYSGPQTVTITDATPGATIYYTTDGTTPNRSSAVFNINNPIIVSLTETIKALAVAPGYTTSPEGVAIYTIAP